MNDDTSTGPAASVLLHLADAQAPGEAVPAHRLPFFSVAIGASAGGVEALVRLFGAFGAETRTGCCFIVVMHLAPDRKSQMVELLGRATTMPVVEASDGQAPQADHVYVIAPACYLQLHAGRFVVTPIVKRPPEPMAVNQLMISLASDQGENSIGVILTGSDGDGTLGLKAIKSEGGMTIAQAPGTAAYEGMPRTAIASGHVDLQLPIEQMPAAIAAYVRGAGGDAAAVRALEPARLDSVLGMIHRQLGLDFEGYKTPMLYRRIRRRMGLSRCATLDDYLRTLADSPTELDALAADFLIGVTEFFREPLAWQALAQQVLPAILRRHADATELRAWVAACSTGEEAYSMAMLLQEAAESAGRQLHIQVFASDVDKRALDIGRRARYPRSIQHTVDPARLKRFFREADGGYQVRKELRQLVTFAQQNVITDPPFSRMDVVSCRNLLIYMQSPLQRRVLQLLHFALRPGGYLMLGKSESAAGQSTLFTSEVGGSHIFQRLAPPRPLELEFRLPVNPPRGGTGPADEWRAGRTPAHASAVQQALAQAGAAPDVAAVVTDAEGNALYFHGTVDRFLRRPDATQHAHWWELLDGALRVAVLAALRKVAADGQAQRLRPAAAAAGSEGTSPGPEVRVAPLEVAGEQRRLLLVSFHGDAAQPPAAAAADADSLQEQLRRTRLELHTAIEELESANEELKVANEEAISTNEELQSTNEELATSKEELESVNEELLAVNQQLELKVRELETVNEDLGNLLASTSIPTIFLDEQMRIKRFTPAATRLFQLIATDLNRPLTDIASVCDMDAIVRDARQVLEQLGSLESETAARDGGVFLRRTTPYRTHDGRIAGVVVTFTDIARLKAAAAASGRLAAVMQASHDAIVVHDLGGRILVWNRGAERMYGLSEAEALHDTLDALLDAPAYAAYADEIARVRGGAAPRAVEVQRRTRAGRRLDVSATVSLVKGEDGADDTLAWIERDISAPKAAGQALRESERRFRTLADSAPVLIWMADRDGVIEFSNQSFASFVGLTARRLTGRKLAELVHRDDADAFARSLAGLQPGAARHESALRLTTRFGGTRWVKCIATWRRGAGAEGEQLMGSMVDIDEQVAAQAELQIAARRKDEFLAMLGHELRNPLVPIRNAAAVLKSVAGQNPQLTWVHDVLVRQVGHVTRLVEDLLDLSLVTRGTLTLHLEPVDLRHALRSAVDAVRSLVRRRRHRLDLDLGDEPVWVEGDAIRLVQVFDNLLSNAAKYTDEGGRLWLTLRVQGDEALVRVRDNGLGISAAALPQIFELFVQDERSIDRSQGGLGIGLALVRRLLELQGGTVVARSEGPGRGAEFEVRLPRLLPPPASAPDVEPDRAREGGRVLIVEDDPDVGESMAVLLRLYGYAVELAHDLEQALQHAREFRPQAVLMDLGMPVHDGFDVARRLRALPEMADAAVFIGVSGFGRPEDLQRSREAGFVHHLVKPVDPDELDRLLRGLLRRDADAP